MQYSVKINLYRTLIVLVLIGALNWGLVALFDYDLVKGICSLFGTNAKDDVSRFVYLLVAMSAVILLIQRDTYLPFLGYTVMPKPINEFSPSGELKTIIVKDLPSNVKVIYWASLPSNTTINNPYDAYGDYSNQGVTTTDDNGVATLKVLNPTSYKVPSMRGILKPHVHYRYWTESGMASPVFTAKI